MNYHKISIEVVSILFQFELLFQVALPANAMGNGEEEKSLHAMESRMQQQQQQQVNDFLVAVCERIPKRTITACVNLEK